MTYTITARRTNNTSLRRVLPTHTAAVNFMDWLARQPWVVSAVCKPRPID